MAKEKEENVADLPATIELDGKVTSIAELAKQLVEAEVGDIITSEYWSIEPGEEKRIIFIEMTEMKGMGKDDNKMVDAVKLLDATDGKYKVNGDVVLVSLCRGLAAKADFKPTALRVIHKGMTTSKNRYPYKDLQVNLLKF